MPSFGIFFAVLIVCTASLSPARAHSPYFSTTEKIELPNGKLGELRLLHGDGMRIPTKPAMHSNMKPATCSDLKPAGVPI